uniref:tRNA-uridine aminocarboxypropyltransferase n=1 Tax=Petromyzon marinus TaxID=7757 RepID=S4RCL9_PETMA
RPQKVCLCPFLPAHPLEVSTRLYIVQHPAEESRVLRTVPLLAACLSAHSCTVLVGRRFPEDRLPRFPELAQVCRSPNTLVLYPGPGAVDLYDLSVNGAVPLFTLVLIDGTWRQAKDMFERNRLLHIPRRV